MFKHTVSHQGEYRIIEIYKRGNSIPAKNVKLNMRGNVTAIDKDILNYYNMKNDIIKITFFEIGRSYFIKTWDAIRIAKEQNRLQVVAANNTEAAYFSIQNEFYKTLKDCIEDHRKLQPTLFDSKVA